MQKLIISRHWWNREEAASIYLILLTRNIFPLLVQSSSIEPKCFGSGYKHEPAQKLMYYIN